MGLKFRHNSFVYSTIRATMISASVIGLLACANDKSDQTNAEVARLRQETASSKERVNKMRKGEQPGAVIITTVKNDQNAKQLEKILVKSLAGKSFDGQRPELGADRVQIKQITDVMFESVHSVSGIKEKAPIVFNVGCDNDFVAKNSPTDSDILNEEVLVLDNSISMAGVYKIRASTVLLCKSEKLQGYDLSIRAQKVVLNGFNYRAAESNALYFGSGLTIESESLLILNTNNFVSKQEPEEFPTNFLPKFSIAVKSISGDGQILIETTGADALPFQ